MILTRDYIEYQLCDPNVDSFDLFLYYCMKNFILTAKVMLDTGEMKPVKNGFLLYMSERLDQLAYEFFVDDKVDDYDNDEEVIGGDRERELAFVREIENDLIQQFYDEHDDRER